MAGLYNVTVAMNVQARGLDKIHGQLKAIGATGITVNVRAPGLAGIAQNASQSAAALRSLAAAGQSASASLTQSSQRIRASAGSLRAITHEAHAAGGAMGDFAAKAGLAAGRFLGFVVAAGTITRLAFAVRDSVREAIEFDRTMVRIGQATGDTSQQIKAAAANISGLATSLGVSSQELAKANLIFRQAGLTAAETAKALESVAEAALAPNFDSIAQTTEGAIAAMRQFNIGAGELKGTLGSINAVAGAFAVEASDIVTALQKAGGAFSAAGGNLNEFISLFTAVRSTTRESAEEIATGLRTIFGRLQRTDTVEALKSLNVELRYTADEANRLGRVDLTDQFVGQYEAIRRISEALRSIPGSDPRFAQVVEQLGGLRQISRVIPLIQQFGEAEKAKNVALAGGLSITTSAERGQEALAVKLTKVKEKFLELGRVLVDSPGFRFMIDQIGKLADTLNTLGKALGPILPLLTAVAATRAFQAVGGLTGVLTVGSRFQEGLINRRSSVAPLRRASGGIVPGSGDGDTVPAMLEPGEFVIRKRAVQAIGTSRLQEMNRYAGGGRVRRKYSIGGESAPLVSTKFPGFDLADAKFYDSLQLSNPVVRDNNSGLYQALREYVDGSGQINKAAAGKRSWPWAISYAHEIRRYLDKSKLPKSIAAFRGFSPDNASLLLSQLGVEHRDDLFDAPGAIKKNVFEKLIGKEFRLPSFTSVALKKFHADDFATKQGSFMSQILLPKGSKVGHTNNPEQSELIIQANSRFRVEDNDGLPTFRLLPRKRPGGYHEFQTRPKKFASGGPAHPEDKVPALLTPGEFVINRRAAARIGKPALERLNRADVQGYNKGGPVGDLAHYSDGGFVLDQKNIGRAIKQIETALGIKLKGLADRVKVTEHGFISDKHYRANLPRLQKLNSSGVTGTFDSTTGQIGLSSQKIKSYQELVKTLSHETTHLIDKKAGGGAFASENQSQLAVIAKRRINAEKAIDAQFGNKFSQVKAAYRYDPKEAIAKTVSDVVSGRTPKYAGGREAVIAAVQSAIKSAKAIGRPSSPVDNRTLLSLDGGHPPQGMTREEYEAGVKKVKYSTIKKQYPDLRPQVQEAAAATTPPRPLSDNTNVFLKPSKEGALEFYRFAKETTRARKAMEKTVTAVEGVAKEAPKAEKGMGHMWPKPESGPGRAVLDRLSAPSKDYPSGYLSHLIQKDKHGGLYGQLVNKIATKFTPPEVAPGQDPIKVEDKAFISKLRTAAFGLASTIKRSIARESGGGTEFLAAGQTPASERSGKLPVDPVMARGGVESTLAMIDRMRSITGGPARRGGPGLVKELGLESEVKGMSLAQVKTLLREKVQNYLPKTPPSVIPASEKDISQMARIVATGPKENILTGRTLSPTGSTEAPAKVLSLAEKLRAKIKGKQTDVNAPPPPAVASKLTEQQVATIAAREQAKLDANNKAQMKEELNKFKPIKRPTGGAGLPPPPPPPAPPAATPPPDDGRPRGGRIPLNVLPQSRPLRIVRTDIANANLLDVSGQINSVGGLKPTVQRQMLVTPGKPANFPKIESSGTIPPAAPPPPPRPLDGSRGSIFFDTNLARNGYRYQYRDNPEVPMKNGVPLLGRTPIPGPTRPQPRPIEERFDSMLAAANTRFERRMEEMGLLPKSPSINQKFPAASLLPKFGAQDFLGRKQLNAADFFGRSPLGGGRSVADILTPKQSAPPPQLILPANMRTETPRGRYQNLITGDAPASLAGSPWLGTLPPIQNNKPWVELFKTQGGAINSAFFGRGSLEDAGNIRDGLGGIRSRGGQFRTGGIDRIKPRLGFYKPTDTNIQAAEYFKVLTERALASRRGQFGEFGGAISGATAKSLGETADKNLQAGITRANIKLLKLALPNQSAEERAAVAAEEARKSAEGGLIGRAGNGATLGSIGLINMNRQAGRSDAEIYRAVSPQNPADVKQSIAIKQSLMKDLRAGKFAGDPRSAQGALASAAQFLSPNQMKGLEAAFFKANALPQANVGGLIDSRADTELKRRFGANFNRVSNLTRQEALDRAETKLREDILTGNRKILEKTHGNISAAERERLARQALVETVKDEKGKLVERAAAVGQVRGGRVASQSLIDAAEKQGINTTAAINQRGLIERTKERLRDVGGRIGDYAQRAKNPSNNFLERNLNRAGIAAQRIGQAGIFALPYINRFITKDETADKAILGGEVGERTFQRRQAASGLATGLITGATIGSAGGAPGAAIGATIGAFVGLASAADDAAQQIRQAKLGAALTDLGNRIQTINNAAGFAPSTDATDSAKQSLAAVQKLAVETAAGDSDSFFTKFDAEKFASLSGAYVKRELAPLLPGLVQTLTISSEKIGRANPQERDNIAGLVEKALSENGGFNRQAAEAVATGRGTSVRSVIDDIVRKTIVSAQNRQNTENALKSANLSEEKTVNAFTRLVISLQSASDSLNGLREKVNLLEESFEGQYGPGRVDLQADRLNQLGRFGGESTIPLEVLRGIGGEQGQSLYRAGTAIDKVATVLPTVLSLSQTKDFEVGAGLTDDIRQRLKELIPDQSEDIKRVINGVLAQIGTATEKQENLQQFRQKVGSDAVGFSEELLKPQSEGVFKTASAGLKIVQDMVSEFNSGLNRSRQRRAFVGEAQERAISATTSRQRLEAELLSNRPGQRGDPLDLLPLEQLQAAQVFRQERLTGLKGAAAEDPARIGKVLADELAKIDRLQTAQTNAARVGDRVGFDKAAIELDKVKERASGLQTALKELTDVTGRSASIREKLNKLDQDKDSRLGFAAKYASADTEGRYQIQKGILLSRQAIKAGSLDNFLPDQQRSIIETLSSLGNAKLTGLGGGRASDYLNNLLETFQGGTFQEDKASKDERANLEGKLLGNAQKGEGAAKVLVDAQKTLLGELEKTLAKIQSDFFVRLEGLFGRDKILSDQVQLGKLGAEKGTADKLLAQANFIQGLGFKDKAQVEANVQNVSAYLLGKKDLNKIDANRARVSELSNVFSKDKLYGANGYFNRYDAAFGIINARPSLVGDAKDSIDKLYPSMTDQQKTRSLELFNSYIKTDSRVANRLSSGRDEDKTNKVRLLDDLLKTAVDASLNEARAFKEDELNKVGGRLIGAVPTLDRGQFNKIADDEKASQNLQDIIQSIGGQKQSFSDLAESARTLDGQFRSLSSSLLERGVAIPVIPKASGGPIFKPHGSDTVPAMLTPGEYVINRESSRANREILEKINKGRGKVQYRASGGPIKPFQYYGPLGDSERAVNSIVAASADAINRLTPPKDYQSFGEAQADAQGLPWDRNTLTVKGSETPQAPAAPGTNWDTINAVRAKVRQLKEDGHIPKQPTQEEVADQKKGRIARRLLEAEVRFNAAQNPFGQSAYFLRKSAKVLTRRAFNPTRGKAQLARLQSYSKEITDYLPKDTAGNPIYQEQYVLRAQRRLKENAIKEKYLTRRLAKYEEDETSAEARYRPLNSPSALSQFQNLGVLGALQRRGAYGPSVNDSLRTRNEIFGSRSRLRFASGGMVPGIGSSDSVPALLTPGEFVFNQKATKAIGANNLNQVQRYAEGGLVGGQKGWKGGGGGHLGGGSNPAQDFAAFAQAAQSLPGFAQTFLSAVNTFSEGANALAKAMAAFPGTLTVTGQQRIDVYLNGAEALSSIQGDLKKMVEESVKANLAKVFERHMPQAGVTIE